MMRRLFVAILFAITTVPALAQGIGWIGASVEDQKDRGAIIRSVNSDGPAAKAGLREGDVIIQFNKEDVIGAQQLTRLIRETPVGRTVDVKVRRDNHDQTFHVTTERANVRNNFNGLDIEFPDISFLRDRTSYSGVRVEAMTDQLRDFFGVSTNDGVLVVSVNKDSPAEKAGLKAGDVIISVDGRNIRTPVQFSREMRAAGSSATLKIVRDKKEHEIKF